MGRLRNWVVMLKIRNHMYLQCAFRGSVYYLIIRLKQLWWCVRARTYERYSKMPTVYYQDPEFAAMQECIECVLSNTSFMPLLKYNTHHLCSHPLLVSTNIQQASMDTIFFSAWRNSVYAQSIPCIHFRVRLHFARLPLAVKLNIYCYVANNHLWHHDPTL